jgi:hypothetical protein
MTDSLRWPAILRFLWLIATLIIGVYVSGSVVVTPILPNGWPNPGFFVVPISALFALALILRHRHAWIVGFAFIAIDMAAVILLDSAYGTLGWRTVAFCAGLLSCLYSIWDLKSHNIDKVETAES